MSARRDVSLGPDLACVFLAIMVASLPGVADAAGGDFDPNKFDPSSCTTGARDKVYITLGPYVLAMPAAGDRVIGRIPPGMPGPQAVIPDSAKPSGCLANPWPLESYGFSGRVTATQSSDDNIKELAVRSVTLFSLPPTDPKSADAYLWPGEKLQLKLAEDVCKTATERDSFVTGVTACRRKQGEKEVLREDWRTSYVSDPKSYGTPLQRPFVINCGERMLSSPLGDCRVTYTLRPGLGLGYKLRPSKTVPEALTINRILEFDRNIRAAILADIVNDRGQSVTAK